MFKPLKLKLQDKVNPWIFEQFIQSKIKLIIGRTY